MNRFQVTNIDDDSGSGDGNGGVDNPAMQIDKNDPVQLNAYGLYTKRNSATCPPLNNESQRKLSYGFTQLTR